MSLNSVNNLEKSAVKQTLIPRRYSRIATGFLAVGMIVGLSGVITEIVVGEIGLFDVPVDGRYYASKGSQVVEVDALAWYISKIHAVVFLSLWTGGVLSLLAGCIATTLRKSRPSE